LLSKGAQIHKVDIDSAGRNKIQLVANNEEPKFWHQKKVNIEVIPILAGDLHVNPSLFHEVTQPVYCPRVTAASLYDRHNHPSFQASYQASFHAQYRPIHSQGASDHFRVSQFLYLPWCSKFSKPDYNISHSKHFLRPHLQNTTESHSKYKVASTNIKTLKKDQTKYTIRNKYHGHRQNNSFLIL